MKIRCCGFYIADERGAMCATLPYEISNFFYIYTLYVHYADKGQSADRLGRKDRDLG